jgi:DNA-binding CsgD family transcriptional regulator
MLVIGREREVDALRRFVDRDVPGPGASSALLEGDAGIGKTTLLAEATSVAHEAGMTVLRAQAARAETGFAFGSLRDLLEPVVSDVLPDLPGPQRDAIQVAVLREAAGPHPAEQHTVAVATLNALRALSASAPVFVALDDIHWVDQASEAVLGFALRRIGDERVRFVTTRRPLEGNPDPLGMSALAEGRLLRMRIEPLSTTDLHRLVRDRLGVAISRPNLRRLHQASGGNPFFALEIVRSTDPDLWVRGAPVPVPKSLRDLLRSRLDALGPHAREAALIAALTAEPTFPLLQATMGRKPAVDGISGAVGAEVLKVESGRPQLAHALLGEILEADTLPSELRELHGRLAEVVTDPEEHARHLALAANGPNEAVATALEEASLRARSRGATVAAAELSDLARQLTPSEHADRARSRTIDTARYLHISGATGEAREVLERAVSEWVEGYERAEAYRVLGEILFNTESASAGDRALRKGLLEAGSDVHLRARLHRDLALTSWVAGDQASAAEHARSALELAGQLDDPMLLGQALALWGQVEFLLGKGVRHDILAQAMQLDAPDPATHAVFRPAMVVGYIARMADDISESRDHLTAVLRQAKELGDEITVSFVHMHLADLEVDAGNWDEAEMYATETYEMTLESMQRAVLPFCLHVRGNVEAHKGDEAAARSSCEQGFALAQQVDAPGAMALNLSDLGFLELSLGRPEEAAVRMGPLAAIALWMSEGEPGGLRFIPDHVEALIAIGNLEGAEPLLVQLEERARAANRIWGLATGARCRALFEAARGDLDAALVAADAALVHHGDLSQPFELGRTLLVAGEVHRRAKHKAVARQHMTGALAIFDQLGAKLWSLKAHAELERVGGRERSSEGLTPSERRVAELVAQGHSNQQVADQLFVARKTVEHHLSRVYHKLGVTSRTQLAVRFAVIEPLPKPR